jgi:hypothetical protein
MVLIWLPTLATTMWDLVGWRGVRRGRLYPLTPARARRGSLDREDRVRREREGMALCFTTTQKKQVKKKSVQQ